MRIEQVVASYGRCCVCPEFFDRFYAIFLGSHPSIKPMVAHTSFTKQKALLREGVAMMLLHLEGKSIGTQCLNRLAKTHSPHRMNITPQLYEYWINSLIATIKEYDTGYTPDLEIEWRKALHAGVHYIVMHGARADSSAQE
ncbi:MAG: globin [Nitrospira sp.]|nr:globin [Nitrospira sp.]